MVAGSPDFGDLNSEFITVRKKRGGRKRDEDIQEEDEEMKRAEQLSLLDIIVKGEDSNTLKRERLKTIREQNKEIQQQIEALKKKRGNKGRR